MKKILVSFCISMVCLFSVVGTFASYTNVSNSATCKISGTTSSGKAILQGRRDDSTDRLSNCTTSKIEKGDMTVSFSSFTRPSQFTAKATAEFYYKGNHKQSSYLSI
ncbi:MAG: hypothetical protein LUG46_08920 [Erysipelotrichaceae bacterium]|nr:hypothetical protein [Erysipelotrichaceae bacterium]